MSEIIVINEVPLTVTGKNSYDGVNKDTQIDFSITKEKSNFIVDIFDAKIMKNKDAFLESLLANTLEEAVDIGYNYNA